MAEERTLDTNSALYDNPKEDNIRIDDQGDLITKFLYEPNHAHYDGEDNFDYMNKNDILTHTTDDEAVSIRPHHENITILTGFKETTRTLVPTGEYAEIGKDKGGNPVLKEIMVEREITVERFAKTIRNEKAFIRSINVTAAGREGKFIKDSKTVRLEKEQSIEDKTETKPGFWAKVNKNKR